MGQNIANDRNFILITPAKNEEKNLGLCIQSIVSQTITPIIWVIVDDGSVDKTYEIIQDAKNKNLWIECIQLKDAGRDLTIHISKVIKAGLDFAISQCKQHNKKYNYIAFIDADMIVPDKNFLKKLIIKFEVDNKLGIASGVIQILDNSNNLSDEYRRYDTVSGGEMMCRREIFDDFAFPLSHAWESVLRVVAIQKGWKEKRFKDLKIIHTRKAATAEGLKKGYYLKGTAAYYLNTNPLLVLVKGFRYCFIRPHYIGIAYLSGYFSSLIKRKEQINDELIKKYFYWNKPLEILKYYFNIFNKGE